MSYSAPVEQIMHSLENVVGLGDLQGKPGFENYDSELLRPILEEAGKLASEVIAPLNAIGDRQGSVLNDGIVTTPDGFKEAYKAYAEGGWLSLPFPEEWGGQAMPRTLAMSVMEMIQSASLSFGLCPVLSCGAIEALLAHGTDDLKQIYLAKLISGEWTGTMNLTEPQAGSDVGALTTKAEPAEGGTYKITGQKIYITWGEHDLADNIIHLVLARLPGAPTGSRGISLFLVPKFIPDANGEAGERNGVKCIGLEQKMGAHASPTCVMEFADAKGWMIGAENKGLACMFTMMNSARVQVGLQGVGVAEAAYQTAERYARERKQGRSAEWKHEGSSPIIYHSDVRRNLLMMASRVVASRDICYACAAASDFAEGANDPKEKARYKLREEILTPIAKAWSTDAGVLVASLGVQVHGGMGFMSDTLAAQFYKDVRITPIYEGTNGIQAADLVGRKLSLANGAAIDDLLSDIEETCGKARNKNSAELIEIAERLEEALNALTEATDWMIAQLKTTPEKAMAAATPYLDLIGDVVGSHYMVRGLVAPETKSDSPVYRKELAISRFYAQHFLPRAKGKSSALQAEAVHTLNSAADYFGMDV